MSLFVQIFKPLFIAVSPVIVRTHEELKMYQELFMHKIFRRKTNVGRKDAAEIASCISS